MEALDADFDEGTAPPKKNKWLGSDETRSLKEEMYGYRR